MFSPCTIPDPSPSLPLITLFTCRPLRILSPPFDDFDPSLCHNGFTSIASPCPQLFLHTIFPNAAFRIRVPQTRAIANPDQQQQKNDQQHPPTPIPATLPRHVLIEPALHRPPCILHIGDPDIL